MSTKATKSRQNVVPDATSRQTLVKQLNDQSKKFFELAKRGNFNDIADLATEDFSFIDDRGVMAMRASCIESMQSMVSSQNPEATLLKVKDFNVSNVQTRVYGDAVIETMIYSDNVSIRNKAEARNETFSRTFRVTNVWVRQGDGWQVASTQMTPVRV